MDHYKQAMATEADLEFAEGRGGITNLKSVRFFNLVLWCNYSIVKTGNLAFTMQ